MRTKEYKRWREIYDLNLQRHRMKLKNNKPIKVACKFCGDSFYNKEIDAHEKIHCKIPGANAQLILEETYTEANKAVDEGVNYIGLHINYYMERICGTYINALSLPHGRRLKDSNGVLIKWDKVANRFVLM